MPHPEQPGQDSLRLPLIPSLPELNHGKTTNGGWWVQEKRKKCTGKEAQRSPRPPRHRPADLKQVKLGGRRSLSLHGFWTSLSYGRPAWAFKGSLVAQTKGICLQCRRHGFDPWVGKIPWRRAWQPTPVFLPEESHGQRSLVGYSPRGHKESDTTERLHSLVQK